MFCRGKPAGAGCAEREQRRRHRPQRTGSGERSCDFLGQYRKLWNNLEQYMERSEKMWNGVGRCRVI